MGGNFNVVLRIEEKYGGRNRISDAMNEFGRFRANDLVDIQTKNGLFTLTNRRKGACCILEKLYRFYLIPRLVRHQFQSGISDPPTGKF